MSSLPPLTSLGADPARWVLTLLVVAVLAWAIYAFNRLVRGRNLLAEGWSGIDVQLKRRHNLVPNLVETVQAYSQHEKRLFESVARLREVSLSADRLADRADHENALTDGLRRMLALAEAYPDLKASRNFLELQKQLAEIEDQIQMARRYYNGAVRDYNIRVQSFPGNLVARLFGFRPEEFFQIVTTGERNAPEVEL